MAAAGIGDHEPVSIVVRNRVPGAAAVLGFIATERPVAMIYSYQSAAAIARDVENSASTESRWRICAAGISDPIWMPARETSAKELNR